MSSTGGWGVPGSGALVETIEREIIWGGDRSKGHVIEQSGNYSSLITDLGNTVTTDIRAGLVCGKITTGGELVAWNPLATDGSQNLFGVNPIDFRTLDFNAAIQDRVLPVIVRAPLKAASLLLLDFAGTGGEAFVGGAYEFLARRALVNGGSILDDDPQGLLAGGITRFETVAATTDTLTASQTGTLITYSNAASVTVTLPDPLLGLEYRLIRTGDEEFVVTSTSLDDIISSDSVAADTVTYTTASMHLASEFHCIAVNDTGTVKWLVQTNTTRTSAAAG